MKRAELRDELYMQLIKQSRGNATPSAAKAWELLYLTAATMPPSKEYVGLVSEYVHSVAHHDGEVSLCKKFERRCLAHPSLVTIHGCCTAFRHGVWAWSLSVCTSCCTVLNSQWLGCRCQQT